MSVLLPPDHKQHELVKFYLRAGKLTDESIMRSTGVSPQTISRLRAEIQREPKRCK